MSDSEFSLLDLFRDEARANADVLGNGLIELEADPADPARIEPLMRAAHSIKGAARIVGIDAAVGLAHVMEDALVAAQNGKIRLTPADIDVLLRGTDVLGSLRDITEETIASWSAAKAGEIAALSKSLEAMAKGVVLSSSPSPSAGGEGPGVRGGGRAPGGSEHLSSMPFAPGTPSPLTPDPSPPEKPGGEGRKTRKRLPVPSTPVEPGEDSAFFDLFREELRQHLLALDEQLPALADTTAGPERFDPLARAAKGVRGGAKIVGVDAASRIGALLEDLFSAARQGETSLTDAHANAFVGAVNLLSTLVNTPEESLADWQASTRPEAEALVAELSALRSTPVGAAQAKLPTLPVAEVEDVPSRSDGRHSVAAAVVVYEAEEPPAPTPVVVEVRPTTPTPTAVAESAEAVVRVTAASLNRLMSLAGESLVQARWLPPFSMSLMRLKKQQDNLLALLDALGNAAGVAEVRKQVVACRQTLADRMQEFDDHAAAAEDLNSRLYREVIASRMRPFSDGAHSFPRLVRDMARDLGKQVRLDIDGKNTEVDRDILEKLEAPLMHLLRNSLDHGLETPDARRRAGKPEQGVLRLDVRHRAGMLALTVSDDGAGIDLERLRAKIVERGFNDAEMVARMTEQELLEFLFLPGFSTAKALTEYSGRGVGLDVVQSTIRKVGGSVRVTTKPGKGTTFHLQLPITLSVLRAVLVDIAGEPFAFPHNRIDRLLRLPASEVRSVEHRQFVQVDGHNVGLVVAAQLLDLSADSPKGEELSVVLLSDDTGYYGLIVGAIRGEQDLVVRPLDPRLGKVPNISAAAILDDGSPVLIADVEDLIRGMDHHIQGGTLRRFDDRKGRVAAKKRILVVDDSITVREVERQTLKKCGYEVDVAVDGKDGWNQVRAARYDLVVSDIDMPRMNGLELVKAIRGHEPTADLPVIVISYKDREEDRRRGMEVGANYYLTKSSFHDETFVRAVVDLIGEA